MKLTLEELIGCATKKSWKRKRDDGEADVEEKGTIVIDEAPASLGAIIKDILWVLATEPEIVVQTGDIEVSPSIPMDVKMVEITPAIALPLPIMVEGEVEVAELLVLALLVELAIVKMVREEELVVASLLAFEAMVKVLLPPPSY